MKKDMISAAVSVVIIAVSSALGVITLGRTSDAPDENRYIEDIEFVTGTPDISDITSSVLTVTSVPVSSSAAVSTFNVTSVSSTVAQTSIPETAAAEITSTVSMTETEPPQTEAPNTEAPEIYEENSQPDPQPAEPDPPAPEPENNNYEIIIPESASEYQREVLRIVNEKRAERGLRGLSGSEQLNNAANVRAEEICTLFSHTRPDNREWYTVFSDFGIAPGYLGENIAAGKPTPAQIVDQWMDSPDHYANMMNENYTSVGIGYYEQSDSEYHYYWVQLFS